MRNDSGTSEMSFAARDLMPEAASRRGARVHV